MCPQDRGAGTHQLPNVQPQPEPHTSLHSEEVPYLLHLFPCLFQLYSSKSRWACCRTCSSTTAPPSTAPARPPWAAAARASRTTPRPTPSCARGAATRHTQRPPRRPSWLPAWACLWAGVLWDMRGGGWQHPPSGWATALALCLHRPSGRLAAGLTVGTFARTCLVPNGARQYQMQLPCCLHAESRRLAGVGVVGGLSWLGHFVSLVGLSRGC